jgi:monofunctional biosynthetic peptidoglycan transglycosylase
VAFFASTILVVVAYKVMPVVVTPLMVIRSVENLAHGKSPFWHHTWVSLKDISPDMPVAVMASEDQRFLIHHGFDFDAIQKAMKRNEAAGKKKYGASTISQQTAKNVFLWQGRTWLRKGLETYFTVLIEFIWGKERIMEVYLNSIEMGDGIYGSEAVAQWHFHCTAAQLTRQQCALIAATLPNPLRFSSQTPSPYVLRRQSWILKQMKHINTLTDERKTQ